MKYIFAVVASLLLFPTVVFAQDYTKHKVEKGETVVSISKKYQITPYDIYRLNPDAKNGIQVESILLIPKAPAKPLPAGSDVKDSPTKLANTVHTVQAKETLYSIAKKYKVSQADLEKANSTALTGGLKAGQELIIPIKGSGVAEQAKTAEKQLADRKETTYMYHTVETGETVYGIAKKYGMTVQLVEELNPEIKDTLPLGYKLKLAKNAVVAESKVPEVEPVDKTIRVSTSKKNYTEYTVQPKETLYSLTKRSGLTEDELLALNPELKDGVKDGMIIKLPADSAVYVSANSSNLQSSLVKSDSKKLALLLPFNMSRIESDTVRGKLLRNDKFLNLTLDFYAGAMVAIDSAKALGLPLQVKILDAKETSSKNSDVAALKNQLAGMNAVVGPFFSNNAETTAALLPNTPVISPLAKETGKTYQNLYYSIPSDEMMRRALLQYLKSRGGNIVALVDKKKTATRTLITSAYPEIKLLEASVTADQIKPLLVSGKTNYVILDTESLGSISTVLRALEEAKKTYDVQLATTEKTDRFDHDEVSLAKLESLKLLYPSITNEENNEQAALFAKIFREKNGYNPTAYATRGFDITFDTILRLFQKDSLSETMTDMASMQVENKFMYVPQNGGNYNNGVYIMQYNDGNTVTKVF